MAAQLPDYLHPYRKASEERKESMDNFRHKAKRGLAVFLALTMCVSLMQVPVFAVEEDTTPSKDEVQTESTQAQLKDETSSEEKEQEQEAEEVEQEPETVQTPVPSQDVEPETTPAPITPAPEEPSEESEEDLNESTGSITTEDALSSAVQNGGTVTLGGNITLTKTLTISKYVTLNLNGYTLSGNNQVSVLTIDGGNVILTGDGTITGGNTTDFPSGGGITIKNSGSLTMENGTITENTSQKNGGGVFVYNGTFTMNGGTISKNNGGNYGGGVYVYNYVETMSAEFIMNGGTISENKASGGGGIGAVGSKKADVRTVVTINDGNITGNTATEGGAIGVKTENIHSSGENLNRLEITGGTISGNEAVNYGGGVYTAIVDADISSCNITENKTTATTNSSSGGGVYIGNGDATLENVAITGNNAVQGGGIFGTGPISLESCDITGNSGTYGGGLRFGQLSIVTMEGNTVTNNIATRGGGIYIYGGKDGKPEDTSLTMVSGKLYGNTSNYSTGSLGADIYSNTATLTLPNAGTMDGKLNDTAITDWFWDGGGEYAWSKEYCVKRDMPFDPSKNHFLIAAYDLRDPVAKIGDTVYFTLQAAFDAAKDGETVEVLRDTTGASLKAEKHITVNIPGDVTVTTVNDESYALAVNSGELAITGTGMVDGDEYGAIAQESGKLTVVSGTITGNHAVGVVAEDTQAALEIKGGLFIAVGSDNVPVVGGNLSKFITGGTFSNDVSNTETAAYVADTYASHPISTHEGYYNVHQPNNQSAYSHDATHHWMASCTGHANCLAGGTDREAHTWGQWTVTTPATTSAPGVETHTCTVCPATGTREIPQLSGGGGSSSSGGSSGGSSRPTPPPTVIEDPDVPLAGAPGLNNTDHFAYIAGYSDGTVRPTKDITRAEVATIFLRLMTEDFRIANWSTSHSFNDAGASEWYNIALAVSAKADILRGYSDGSVKPNAAITRAEFATIAARFLGENATDEGVGDFSDTGSHWAAKDIRRAAKAGWIKGDGNQFRPNDSITRAEVVTIVNRMLDRVPDQEHMLSDMKTWSDNPVGTWYYADVQEASNDHAYQRDEAGITEHWTELTAPKDWTALEAAWIANNGASAPKTDGK